MDLNRFGIDGPLTGIETIAINRSVRELQNLKKLFGPGRRRKLKGFASAHFENGMIFRAELHWYEAHGIGKRKMKVKRLLEQLK